jgi:threonylcarbamoyladenosine tRNA methylthiotransferase MtaB
MPKNKTVAFYTLGCKLNQAETENLTWQFIKSGYSIAEAEKADIFVLNTCTVTHVADRKARHMIRMIRRINPRAVIVAAGCYAQRASAELLTAGADIAVDNKDKNDILRIINYKFDQSERGMAENPGEPPRVRSFIKIQDGCQHFCSYCIVPLVRRDEFCLPEPEIINVVKDRIAQGYKEVVLTGTEIGRYRDNSLDLAGLISRILNSTGLERLHLSSLQPQEISEELLQLWQDKRLSQHFHLALQSGSDAVLNRMHREYDTGRYLNAVSLLRRYIPDVAITTDIIAGFPGESEQEFEESYNFCRDTGFAGMHVFSYSPRPGTEAAGLPGQVDEKVKKLRSDRMLALSRNGARDYRDKYLGKTMSVLFENEVTPGSGMYSGLSENYIRVFARSSTFITGSILPVIINRHYHQDVRGEVIR